MSDAEEARLRRLRLLRKGMENLGMPLRPEPVRPSEPERAAEPPSSASTQEPAALELAAAIERRHQQLSEPRTHFEVLGLPRGADRDAVKGAFLALVKQFHPDRLPPSMGHLAGKLNAIFEQLREAQEVLSDEVRRAVYIHGLEEADRKARAMAEGGGPAQAADLFRQGEVALRRRDLRTAEALYEKAHGLDPKPLYLAAQGWAIYLDTSRKGEVERAKSLIASALKADPRCDRAAYQLGVIAKVEGDVERAQRHFREAIRLNEKHLEAQQELRLIDLRRGRGAPRS